jgi:hypothetical protein
MSSGYQRYRPYDSYNNPRGSAVFTLQRAWRIPSFRSYMYDKESSNDAEPKPFPVPRPKTQLSLDRYVTGVRHSTCFIARLPPELLAEIFSLLPWAHALRRAHRDPLRAELAPDTLPDPRLDLDRFEDGEHCILDQLVANGCARLCTNRRPWRHYSILRVCKTWRDVACACPLFWCRIPLYDERAARYALELSRNVPIYVIAEDGSETSTESAFSVALTALHRIRELRLPEYSSPISNSRALISQPAPLLESLACTYAMSDMPEMMFSGQTPPCLLSLKCFCIQMPRLFVLYAPTLTHLEIYSETDIWQSAEELVNTLSGMPLLEEIHLGSNLSADLAEPYFQPTCDPLSLMHTRVFNVGGTYTSIPNVLGILHFPAMTTLSLRFSRSYNQAELSEEQRNEAMHRNLSFFSGHFTRDAFLGLSTSHAHLSVNYICGKFTWTFAGQVNPSTPASSMCFIHFEHSRLFGSFLQHYLQFAASLASLVPSHDVTSLTIQQTSRPPADLDQTRLWCSLPLHGSSSVRHILLKTDAPMDFLYWLNQEATCEGPYLPLLESVTISECDLDEVAGILSTSPAEAGTAHAEKRHICVHDLIRDYWDWCERARRVFSIRLLKRDLDTDERLDLFNGLERRFGSGTVQCLDAIEEVPWPEF